MIYITVDLNYEKNLTSQIFIRNSSFILNNCKKSIMGCVFSIVKGSNVNIENSKFQFNQAGFGAAIFYANGNKKIN